MKKTLVYLSSVALAIAIMSFTLGGRQFRVDTAKSSVNWKGYKVTGSHEGTVSIKNGEILFENGKLLGGKIIMDMNSITCTDLSGEYATKLVGHLKADDFFGVNNHPTATLEITKIAPKGTPDEYKLTADLTIKNIKKEVKFFANVKQDGKKVVGSGKITIDRTDYNIRYGSGSIAEDLGDKTIYDEFDLNFNFVAAQ
ncbi:MAG: YceI family protein [Saprospiraceae bacterium]|nr:YceI family protein [Saprospiraceae bacterium]